MDDSGMSFFDYEEFNFAKDQQNENREVQNKLEMTLFSSKALEDAELSGFISVKISKNMKTGSFFLRLETTEELNLEKLEKDDTLTAKLKQLTNRITKVQVSERKPFQKLTKVLPQAKSSMMVSPHTPQVTARPLKEDFFTLRDEEESRELVKKVYTKLIFDLEIFSLENEINQFTGLVLPFRIKLSRENRLYRSCHLLLDNATYYSLSKKKQNTIKKMNLESGKLELYERRFETKKETPSVILEHKLTAYYVPKNDFHNFNLIHQLMPETEKSKIRYEYLQKYDLFLSDSKPFFIIPNYRVVDYKKHAREAIAEIENDNQLFLCCNKKTPMNVSISLDIINIRKYDSSLNFVMTFDKRIIKEYFYLDVIIYNKLTHHGEEMPTIVSENVCMVESFDLESRLPPKSLENQVEYVQKLDLTPILGKYQSIESYHAKLDFFIRFYLSSLSLRLEKELFEINLNFLRLDSDFTAVDPDSISKTFLNLEKKIAPFKSCILLPYVFLDFKTNIDADGLLIDEKKEQLVL